VWQSAGRQGGWLDVGPRRPLRAYAPHTAGCAAHRRAPSSRKRARCRL